MIALEGGPHGVTSNTVAPAYVRTPLVERCSPGRVVKRLIDPAEVAELAAFLCSPAADFITGACLPIDGGWMAQ